MEGFVKCAITSLTREYDTVVLEAARAHKSCKIINVLFLKSISFNFVDKTTRPYLTLYNTTSGAFSHYNNLFIYKLLWNVVICLRFS